MTHQLWIINEAIGSHGRAITFDTLELAVQRAEYEAAKSRRFVRFIVEEYASGRTVLETRGARA